MFALRNIILSQIISEFLFLTGSKVSDITIFCYVTFDYVTTDAINCFHFDTLQFVRNGIVRTSRRGNSSVYTHFDVIFCNRGCDWRSEHQLSFCLYLFPIIILYKGIYEIWYGIRSMIYLFFDVFINTLVNTSV